MLTSSALVVYEYLLTFTQEVSVFWTKRQTGASILFFLNRYLLVMYMIVFPLEEVRVFLLLAQRRLTIGDT